MRAMLLEQVSAIDEVDEPLRAVELPVPQPGPGEVLIRVHACGICHTELDEIHGRVPARLPVIPGHQVIGTIEAHGPGTEDAPAIGQRIGVGWIFSACGQCDRCLEGRENLCDAFHGTGCHVHGGYAEYMTAPSAFVHPIPGLLDDIEAAPMLCGGAIGLRSLHLCKLTNGQVLGLTGFGGSNHQVLQLARILLPDSPVMVWARNPDQRRQALGSGADWAGDTEEQAPRQPDAIIDTTPAWKPVMEALRQIAPGGRLVVNAISKESDDRHLLADLDYSRQLWQERMIRSVANVTREDIRGFLEIAAKHRSLRPVTRRYRLEQANQALREMQDGQIRGAKVLDLTA
ncbi:alcohol dehydrogenase catalytic domain-containing protein [Wenzhouxiangella sp. AB-CW3]|uniref:alcohol dehydrogenase catalytic domain-containing protein n=1 Tax=Wenzhouxiangella sp. AB-CW3 TaxID=2771012 RepID=UPI00168BA400|nr:alcohol dehydrogenase catalytic domain-containing protein [Wenzhouxiangella sp. AB-CW3]QOC23563.1 alcohol dehydrogenase catalytic domain-containing protein [Wenzhouxiangella sp. AB-CW3]